MPAVVTDSAATSVRTRPPCGWAASARQAQARTRGAPWPLAARGPAAARLASRRTRSPCRGPSRTVPAAALRARKQPHRRRPKRHVLYAVTLVSCAPDYHSPEAGAGLCVPCTSLWPLCVCMFAMRARCAPRMASWPNTRRRGPHHSEAHGAPRSADAVPLPSSSTPLSQHRAPSRAPSKARVDQGLCICHTLPLPGG